MKNISAFQAILYTVFGLAALIGLFVFATYTSKSGQGTIGTVHVWGTLPEDEMNTLLTALGQDVRDLQEVTYEEKNPSTLPTDLAAAIATGASPDLVLDSQENLLSIARFLTVIPPSTLSTSAFAGAFIAGADVFQGVSGYYGVPFLVDPLVLYSNRAILASAGVAKPPATWEALTGLVPKIALFTPNRQIQRGLIALGSYDNVHNARAILSTLFLQTGVPITGYSANGSLSGNLGANSASGVPPGISVLGFYTQFADPAKVSYTWNASLGDSQRAFQVGELALYLGFASEARYLQAANPNLSFMVSPAPQPGTAAVKNVYGRIYAFMIPNGAPNPAGAYQAAALLTDVRAQAAAAALTGLAPAALDQLANVPGDPLGASAYTSALYTVAWLSPAAAATDQVFGGMINSVISGRLGVEPALGVAEQALTSLISR
jgi:ABC-type glycerol-3-phosphate transport system substrate-binding protein